MVVVNHFQYVYNQHLLNLLIDTFHNHHLYMFDLNKHNDHSNIYHDYDMMNHINQILFENNISIFFSKKQNIRPGIIQSGRYEGVEIHTRLFEQ